jgi:outer membrane beta-barrel protein
MKILLFSMMMLSLTAATATADVDLNAQLDELKLPGNVAPAGITNEKLYSSQSRFATLARRTEFNLGMGQNFTGNGFVRMRQLNGSIAYHLNDRWSVSASGSYGFNDFTRSAEFLMMNEGIVPDAAIVKWRADLLANYNLFYGKFRTSIDQVFYFDQYVSAGPGLVNTQYGTTPAAVADIGFALWIGKNWSTRFGVKNQFFREKTQLSNDTAYHMLGHIEVGYLIGGNEHAYE